ncbi:Ldh family oxidoreductase [Paenibacillus xerothermodurans]|uniref:Ldh family oxidoreductase n=1 Tax=Paenibacillus xerothermodurans TaxID=1977292 RepID=A0A2W1NZZ6_PAEXE|nr:Ldh family oxidoreductase [Paenibacillus xerothermodurans]PZE21052.1 Ldh family oxidoreductase [Paenibacillus xerothermodurans]
MSDIIVQVDQLRQFCTDVFAKSLPQREAAIIADNLVDADLLGVESHGVSRVPGYLKRMEQGLIERSTNISLISETPTTAMYDAGNGWGQVVAVKAMQAAIDKAKAYGTAFVGVNNSNHFGTCSYYTRMAAAEGCIGIAMTNSSAMMVPFGSLAPSLGTNPLSFAIPTGAGQDPVVLDMATSNVARGKIIVAKTKGNQIPEGWAVTKDGEPTTDPIAALEGFLLPMGSKGSGLAIMVDVLSGVLTGALFGKRVPRMYEDPEPQNIGHFFGVIRVDAFMPLDEFYRRMQEKIDETVKSQPAKGFNRVYMPGEIESLKMKKQLAEGIALSPAIFRELEQTGRKYGVDIQSYMSKTEETML